MVWNYWQATTTQAPAARQIVRAIDDVTHLTSQSDWTRQVGADNMAELDSGRKLNLVRKRAPASCTP